IRAGRSTWRGTPPSSTPPELRRPRGVAEATAMIVVPAQSKRAARSGSMDDGGMAPPGQTLFQGHLGIRYFPPPDDAPAGTIVVRCDVRDDLRGPAGSLEGGVVATLIDVAGASAAARGLRALVATQGISVSYLAPVRVGPANAVAIPVRVGKRDAVVEVRVTDNGNDHRLCAIALLNAVALGPLT